MSYVELHCHSNYSFQEGASSIEEIVSRAAELGYPALALTDHNNLCGAMEFAQIARSLGIQPISGAEVTIEGDTHLTLLASNRTGYSNLCRLITSSYIEADRQKPKLKTGQLVKYHQGIILLTGCRKGLIPRLVTEDRMHEAEVALKQYIDWFSIENVFIELQQNLIYGDTKRNRRLVELSHRVGVQVVATNNTHYHIADRHRLQDALVAIQHNKSLEETHRERRPNNHFHLKHHSQMTMLFRDLPAAIENTLVLAERCKFDLTRDLNYKFPDYPVPDNYTPFSYLKELCDKAAVRHYGSINQKVDKRLNEEFRLIKKHNLAGFLLIYHDIIQMARQIQIELGHSDMEIPLEERPPGRGRGSSVAMLTGYLIGLSHIDPLKFDLSLERFLQDEMVSVPDIDLDFPRDIRDELIKRVHQRWGWERAALTGMISTYKIKGAIRDLGKALALPFQDIDRLAKRVETSRASSLYTEMKHLPEFNDRTDAIVWKDLIDLAKQLNGFPKYLAQHPGGMIISSSPLTNIVPVQQSALDGRYICHWDKDSIDTAGFVKIDFLALGALSQMQDTLQLIEQRTEHYIDLSRIDFEDSAVYETLHRADTVGIFQVESAAQMQTITRIKPNNLTDMAYEVAAVRPGVGANDGVTQFIRRRQGESWNYDHPLERKALERTLGIILYQDQVNQVAIDVAGFDSLEADQLRRAFHRRNNDKLLDHYHKKFLDKAAGRGITQAVAERIFKKFNGQYMFPESHAFAFGVTAYHMAWLKYYYPLEFFVSIFNQQPMGFYNLETLKEDAKRHEIIVLKPNINTSAEKCIITRTNLESDSASTSIHEALLIGFLNVKSIGKTQAKTIVNAREKYGQFTSVEDVIKRTGLRREAIENLVMAGVFDSLAMDRRSILWEIGLRYRPISTNSVRTKESKSSDKYITLPKTPYHLDNRTDKKHKPLESQQPLALPVNQDMANLTPMTAWDHMTGEYQTIGLYPEGHLMDHIRPKLSPQVFTSDTITHLKNGTKIYTAGLVIRRQRPLGKAVFMTLEDEFGHIPLIIYPAVYDQYRLVLREPVLIVQGIISRKEGTMNIRVIHAKSLHTLKGGPASKNWR